MSKEIWVGLAELRQLLANDTSVRLKGQGASTWWACWANDDVSFKARVDQVSQKYGLFVTEFENVMAYKEAVKAGLVGDELEALAEHASEDEEFCVFGNLNGYKGDN
jgi:hypothetical protein